MLPNPTPRLFINDTTQQRHSGPSIATALSPRQIGWQTLGPAVAFTALALWAVIMRLYTRLRIARCSGVEDLLVIGSMMLSIAYLILTGLVFEDGQDAHEVEGTTRHDHAGVDVYVAALTLASNTIYIIATTLTKTSLLTLYLRISSHPTFAWLQRTSYFLLFCLLMLLIWGVFGGIFICRPVSKLFKPDIEGECFHSAEAYWDSVAGLIVVLDFGIWVLPMGVSRKLVLSRGGSWGVVGVFGLGEFTCIISLIRLLVVHIKASEGHFNKSGISAVRWSTIELNTGIICACLLCLRPLLRKVWPRYFSSRYISEDEQEMNTNTSTLVDMETMTKSRTVSKSQRQHDIESLRSVEA